MRYRSFIAGIALAALLSNGLSTGDAQAFDESKYPNLKGQWDRFIVRGLPGQPSFDQTRPWGFGQEAPLTPVYRAVLEASLADQARGGLGNYPTARCLAAGMPHIDGRNWPAEIVPTFQGYSIGRWIDEDGDGRYDVLEVETRGPFKGPRALDATGLPLHFDNESVFKERIFLDKSDPNLLHDVITIIDHALTRPWTVDKRYVRNPDLRADWPEFICAEYNAQVTIGRENYFLSADGLLMPTRKDQPPPDARYFKQTQK